MVFRRGVSLRSLGIAALCPLLCSAQAPEAADANAASGKPQAIIWAKVPGKSELDDYEPDLAHRMAQDGDSSIQCKLLPAGIVTGCVVVSESPAGFGFGLAAIAITRFFKAAPATEDRAVLISVHWGYRGGSAISTAVARPS